MRWCPRTGRAALAAGLAALWLFSTPLVAYTLVDLLQDRYPAIQPDQVTGGHIVVMGAGRYPDAPEYGRDVPSRSALERLRYAAFLARQSGRPLILTGGPVYPREQDSEAMLSARVLSEDYGIEAVRLEEQSTTTCENALNTRRLLQGDNGRTVTVVTHAWHMPRAMWCFGRVGIPAQAAPTGFVTPFGSERGVFSVMPSARAMAYSSAALHEMVGMLWYRVVY